MQSHRLAYRLALHGGGALAHLLGKLRVLDRFHVNLELAKAPSIAALASATEVVRSDFMLGFVIDRKPSAMGATSLARSATPRGTLVACFNAASMI